MTVKHIATASARNQQERQQEEKTKEDAAHDYRSFEADAVFMLVSLLGFCGVCKALLFLSCLFRALTVA